MVTQTALAQARQALLAWYARQGRDLPWRRTRDPYYILVAEVMLQQTQVDRVVPKYREFLEAFPTVTDLAEAPRGEVIRCWAPLGYNLRAVRLHQMAQQVVSEWSGQFPRTVEELLQLKGIGPYTAGAVACFAYEQPTVFLDTNLRRVLGRCFGGLPYPHPTDDKAVLAVAEAALPRDQAYAWHQALMDVGATICSWAKPRCLLCPLAEWCQARPLLALKTGNEVSEGDLSWRERGTGNEARRVAEERPVYRAQARYAGSRRYYRGKVVGILRARLAGDSLSLEEMGRALKPDFSPDDLPWLAELVSGLAKDGLVSVVSPSEDASAWRVALPS